MSDFHRAVDKFNYSKALKKGLDNGTITKSDYDLIVEYVSERKAKVSLSKNRVNKITSHLINWRRYLEVEYKLASITDIYLAINSLKDTGDYKQNTVHDYIIILKPFLEWLDEAHNQSFPEKKIREIRAPCVDHDTIDHSEILSPEEVLHLIDAARSVRNRAILSTLYESGCRPAELARALWKDVVFDEYGVKFYILDTKTKKRRYSRLTISTEYLSTLKDLEKPKADDIIFVSEDGKPLAYAAYRKILNTAVEVSGIDKHVTLKRLRTYRATHLIAQGYQETAIKKSLWGNVNTKMFHTYVKLSEDDIDHEFLNKAGIVKSEVVDNPLLPMPCHNCHFINAPGSLYCSKCGQGLTDKAIQSLEDSKKALANNEDIKMEEFAEMYKIAKERNLID